MKLSFKRNRLRFVLSFEHVSWKDVLRTLAIVIIVAVWGRFTIGTLLDTYHQHQNASRAQNETQRTVAASPVGSTQEQAARQQTQDWNSWVWSDAGAEWTLALISFFGIWAALKTLYTLQEATKANIIAANAAKKSANAAAASAQTADLGLRAGERAYLITGEWSMTRLEVGKPTDFEFKFINTGHTPARVVSTLLNVDFFTEIPPVPDYSGLRDAPPHAGSRITQSSALTMYPRREEIVTEAQYDQIVKGELRLLVWGILTYKDIFKDVHKLPFGMFWKPERGKFLYAPAAYHDDGED